MMPFVEAEHGGKRFLLRSELEGTAGQVFQAVGEAAPPTVQQLDQVLAKPRAGHWQPGATLPVGNLNSLCTKHLWNQSVKDKSRLFAKANLNVASAVLKRPKGHSGFRPGL
jgi:hypothetical protein